MTEFQEVIRQYNRMCKKIDDCSKCQMSSFKNPAKVRCSDLPYREPEYFEKTVMSWATEHPEPVYPSWYDAWEQLFPKAIGGTPCPKHFIDDEKQFDGMCIGTDCEECLEKPIPADIAEKLGIKPVEVEKYE